MRINKITNINFKEEPKSIEKNSENAILMLRDPQAAVKFQQSQEYAKKADSIDTNPIVALGYKLYRTFNIIKGNETPATNTENKLDTVA